MSRKTMPCMRWNCIDSMFTAVCFIGTVIMVGYWIVRYHKNEDVSLVEYRSMDTIEDPIQVAFSLCIQNPFLEDEFKKISSDLSSADYIKYLIGIIPGKQTYEKISYENVTINLSDHFENLIVVPRDNSKWIVCSTLKECPFLSLKNNMNSFTPFSSNFFKCFGIGIDIKHSHNVKTIKISFGSSLAPLLNKIGPIYPLFNYPEQLLLANGDGKPIWENPNESRVWKYFAIRNMEILRQRYKVNDQCVLDWKVFDTLMLQQHIEKVGCRPPYLKKVSEISLCDTQMKIRGSIFDGMFQSHRYVPPCHSISKLDHDYTLYPKDTSNQTSMIYVEPTWYSLMIDYPNKIKFITQEQAVDFQALVGYVGGYVGLFLGKCRNDSLPHMI